MSAAQTNHQGEMYGYFYVSNSVITKFAKVPTIVDAVIKHKEAEKEGYAFYVGVYRAGEIFIQIDGEWKKLQESGLMCAAEVPAKSSKVYYCLYTISDDNMIYNVSYYADEDEAKAEKPANDPYIFLGCVIDFIPYVFNGCDYVAIYTTEYNFTTETLMSTHPDC